MKFDGAFRAGSPHPGAAAVFTCCYECPFSKALPLPHAITSNECEIRAAQLALQQTLLVAENTGCTNFVIVGDSSHVIECLRSGRALSFTPNSRLPNAQLWRELALSLKKCLESSLSLSFIWRPRRYNAEADELCNACLDKRDPNLSVFSPSASPPSPLIVEEVIMTAHPFYDGIGGWFYAPDVLALASASMR